MIERGINSAAAASRMADRASRSDRMAFGDFFLSRLFGFDIRYDDDSCILRFSVEPGLLNPQGSLHGGVLATALDVSMGHLMQRIEGAGATLEVKVQYLRPVRAGLVTCRSHLLKRGRSVWFMSAEARAADGKLVAHATSTWTVLQRAPRGERYGEDTQ